MNMLKKSLQVSLVIEQSVQDFSATQILREINFKDF